MEACLDEINKVTRDSALLVDSVESSNLSVDR